MILVTIITPFPSPLLVLTSTVRLLVNAAPTPSLFEAIPVTLETPNSPKIDDLQICRANPNLLQRLRFTIL
jgi:hypothetical protein